MNAERLIRMAINMVLRRGLRQMSKGGKSDPKTRTTRQSLKTINRIRRM